MTRNQDQDAYQELIETFLIQAERLAGILAATMANTLSMTQLATDYNRQYGPGCWRSAQTCLTFQTFLELFPRTFHLLPPTGPITPTIPQSYHAFADSTLPPLTVTLTQPRIPRAHDTKKEVRNHYLTHVLSAPSADSSSATVPVQAHDVEAKLTSTQLLRACLPTTFHLFYTRSAAEADRFVARNLDPHEAGFALSIGSTGKVALIALVTAKAGLLFHVHHSREGCGQVLRRVLEDPEIKKAGFDGKAEAKRLEAIGVDCEGVVDVSRLALQNGHRRLFVAERKVGMREVVACYLNLKVEKRQVRSPWDASELSEAQRVMAATDAWLSLKCYQVIYHTRHRLPSHQTAHRIPLHLTSNMPSGLTTRRECAVSCAAEFGYQLVGETPLGDDAVRLVFEQDKGRERVDEELLVAECDEWDV
ncbi:ribonuclease H-like domain-containing protein [Jimgerdemannia flammicorona]|uniref:Ribonuclease H-like domain-containing protein n=1 Tax=Jimgerdemannia flammicorona TaxID=994334 RepID=A0A433D815_9FUNG|nr:ribonuclease H-like domain-containing protein [Jimgerdemannia flammicorona]